MLGRFYFEEISKSVKMQIWIAFQHKDACIVVVQRLNSNDYVKNQVYVNIIDNFYVIEHARRR